MNKNKKVAWIYIAVTVLLSFASVAFHYLVRETYVEKDTGLYISGVAGPGIYGIFLATAALLILTCSFLFNLKSLPREENGISVLTSVTSFLAGGTLVFSAISFFTGGMVAAAAQTTSWKLKLVSAILAAPAAVYYLTVSFAGGKKTTFKKLMSFFPLLWTLIYLMSIYFDKTVIMNSQVKIIKQVALIFFMLFELLETRQMLGMSKPLLYYAFSGLSVLFLTTSFVPEMIYIANGTSTFGVQASYDLYCCAAALYVISKSVDFAVGCDTGGKTKEKSGKHGPADKLFTGDGEEE